jgi:hypothetical protein
MDKRSICSSDSVLWTFFPIKEIKLSKRDAELVEEEGCLFVRKSANSSIAKVDQIFGHRVTAKGDAMDCLPLGRTPELGHTQQQLVFSVWRLILPKRKVEDALQRVNVESRLAQLSQSVVLVVPEFRHAGEAHEVFVGAISREKVPDAIYHARAGKHKFREMVEPFAQPSATREFSSLVRRDFSLDSLTASMIVLPSSIAITLHKVCLFASVGFLIEKILYWVTGV